MTYSGGNEKNYLQTLREYKKVHREDLEGIKSALEAGDRKNACRMAHTLKSSSAIIGAEALSGIALRVEKALGDSGQNADLESIMAELDRAFLELMAELDALPEPEIKSAPLDRERALALMEKLIPLLETSEAVVFTLRDEIEEVFAPLGAEGEELLSLIDIFEFPAAAKFLLKIKSKL